jgi:hypothetical protein
MCTRPDISHAVNMIARDQAAVTSSSILRAKRIFRYLAGTIDLGITYHREPKVKLRAFTDADWAGDGADAKSTTGSLLVVGGAAIHWISRKQSTVSHSTSEAEYVAASETAKEVIWYRQVLADLGFPQKDPTPLYIDNRTAISMTTEEGHHERRKHINVRYHGIREWVHDKLIDTLWVSTKEQQADLLTKALGPQVFIPLRDVVLGLQDARTLKQESK